MTRVRSALLMLVIVTLCLHFLAASLVPLLPFGIAVLIFLFIGSLIF